MGGYTLLDAIASGGMATLHLARLCGPAGFTRVVAAKRLHPRLAGDPEFVQMFLDEARLAARVRHPNVVSVDDVMVSENEILLVMDYVHGASLGRLVTLSAGVAPPLDVACGIGVQMLRGLHAAHEALAPDGSPLRLVHRDVSPQNVLVGADGVVRVTDFGIAKATWRLRETQSDALRGKVAYMAPEQLRWEGVDRRTDIFAAAIVLWELLTGARLFTSELDDVPRRLREAIAAPSSLRSEVPPELDAIVARGLALDREDRFASAQEMADAIEMAVHVATPSAIAEWVSELAGDSLRERSERLREIEADTRLSDPPAGMGEDVHFDTTVVSPPPDVPRSVRRPLAIAASTIVALGFAGGAVAFVYRTPHSVGDLSAPGSAASSVVHVAVEPRRVDPNPSTSGVGGPEEATSAKKPPALRSSPRRPASLPSAPLAKACDPPFVYDSEGVKVFKDACISKAK